MKKINKLLTLMCFLFATAQMAHCQSPLPMEENPWQIGLATISKNVDSPVYVEVAPDVDVLLYESSLLYFKNSDQIYSIHQYLENGITPVTISSHGGAHDTLFYTRGKYQLQENLDNLYLWDGVVLETQTTTCFCPPCCDKAQLSNYQQSVLKNTTTDSRYIEASYKKKDRNTNYVYEGTLESLFKSPLRDKLDVVVITNYVFPNISPTH